MGKNKKNACNKKENKYLNRIITNVELKQQIEIIYSNFNKIMLII